MAKKIVLIGAGSAMFTQGLVADLILSPQLGPYHLCLVDIDPDALAVAVGLARKLVETQGAELTISGSTDRRELLPGAEVVLMTVGVGGRRAWEQDVFIPRKYGIYQPVGDSMMPGGVSRAMRMIPALVAIAKDVKELCPNALFINYSNPMTANCWAIIKETGLPVIGLCHGAFRVERALAEVAGIPAEEVSSIAIGLNHLTFFYDLRWKGQDAWPRIREKLPTELQPTAGAYPYPKAGNTFNDGGIGNNPFSWSLFQAYGGYPSANDRHVVEFFPERFPNGQYYGMQLGIDAYSLEEVIAWGDNIYADMRAQALGEKPLEKKLLERKVGEHEQLLQILTSIEHDERRIFYANLPNQGAVPNLPEDAILELPAVAMAGGMRAIHFDDFPDTLAAIINRKLSGIRLTVEAALTGDRNLFVEALLADGAVNDRQVATDMMNELLEVHHAYLPNFFPAEVVA
jgi:alpha-galactosidase